MKSTVLLLVFAGLMSIGAAVMAEPITRADDSVPVTIDIAKWVWVDICDEDGFTLDYEAGGQPYAVDSLPFKVGHNCDAILTGSLVRPTGAPGTWTWWFQGHNNSLRLLLDGPVNNPDLQHDAGVFDGRVSIRVAGIRITDRATTYTGGTLTINVNAL